MKSLEVIEIQNMMGITDVQPQWFINFLKKNSASTSGNAFKSETMSNQR